ncbi:MAG: superoxide dismutase family protein [Gammaproteobacteria bacterium]|nr:superoxide dismutase family protein [Gammaproteobacteria bacterium]MDH3434394.1 superoxide dismutase family protein [Gammaproteobacteria bacterium]
MLISVVFADSLASDPERSTTLREVTAGGIGRTIGTVRFEDSEYGLLLVPDLHGLEPGPHAAHIHENPDCGADANGTPAAAAGDHFDPEGSGVHAGPYADGHLGDLPNLVVEADRTARITVLAPRLTAADVKGHALMIHAGADRYDAHAGHRHGKGGPRMYCGVIL